MAEPAKLRKPSLAEWKWPHHRENCPVDAPSPSLHGDAKQAARIVALEQQVGGEPAEISYQDAKGAWHTEYSDGGDRPEAEIVDDAWQNTDKPA